MWNTIGTALLLGAPWLLATIWAWLKAPRFDGVPPSMADRARDRLWA